MQMATRRKSQQERERGGKDGKNKEGSTGTEFKTELFFATDEYARGPIQKINRSWKDKDRTMTIERE